jgi:hypothetical protein
MVVGLRPAIACAQRKTQARNPRNALGFASLNPTYEEMTLLIETQEIRWVLLRSTQPTKKWLY